MRPRLLQLHGLSMMAALAVVGDAINHTNEIRLEPPMLLPDIRLGALDTPSHPIMKKYARRPAGRGRNWFVPHQNTRECARRIVQIAKGQLTGYVPERRGRKDLLVVVKKKRYNAAGAVLTRPRSLFVSEEAHSKAQKLRLRAIGLHANDPQVAR